MSKLNQPVLYKNWICFGELVKLVLNHCMYWTSLNFWFWL